MMATRQRNRRLGTRPETNGTSALKRTPAVPTRDQWQDWVKHIVAQKETIIDELYQRIDQMEQNAINQAQTAIQPVQHEITLRPRMTVQELLERDRDIREIIDNVLIPGVDYGPPFPGAKENALRKSGAEKFMAIFELRPDYIEVEKVVERAAGSVATAHIRYEYRCNLHLGSLSGPVVGAAIGVCSSEEDRYKYRKLERTCPECGEAYIYRSKHADKKTGDKGWYCWNNPDRGKHGCGAKFVSDDERITGQDVGREINPDLMGLQHTIAAMAQKRAFVLALRTTTGISAYFSETVSDDDTGGQRTTINSTATVKTSASIAGELIEYAESLLPEGHGYSRNQIGAACLQALGMKSWSDDHEGSLDDAKKTIAVHINEKVGNGEKTETGQKADTPAIDPETGEVLSAKCETCNERDATGDGPFPTLCALCAKKAGDREVAKDSQK